MAKTNVFNGLKNPDRIKQKGGKTMKAIGIGIIAFMALLIVATTVMAANKATIVNPAVGSEICGKNTYNVSMANVTDGFDPIVINCWVGATLVINSTNGSAVANVTDVDISSSTWIVTPSDAEGVTLNCTLYAAGYQDNGVGSSIEEGDDVLISIDNTAPTFTFTPADGAVVEEGNQIITATSTSKLSGYGLTFDNQGRAVTISSDAYSFTYTVNSDEYSDGLYPYSAVGTDNSSCSNSRTSDVKYLEIDHKGSIQPALQAQQQAASQQAAQASAASSSKLKDSWLFFLLLIGVVVYLIFFRKN